jgi:Spy/CpxP family protein refolding chaperone
MMGGGWGMGPGMMGGGWGMGPGLGGYGLGGIGLLDLSSAQRSKINAIADELRKKQWAVLGQIQDDDAKLRDLSAQAEPDPKAVGSVYVHMSKLRQQMIELHANAMDQARAVLTPEQRSELDRWQLDMWGPQHPRRGVPPGRP